jgi:acetyl esterase/lipase
MIKLWEDKTPYFDESIGQEEPVLTPYIAGDGAVRPAIIVCPGGGYHHRAYHEGEPVAQWLNSLGISAFVLNYRLSPYTYKAIENDVYRAIRVVRYNAEKWRIDPGRIGTLGFSAGGHLASCSALYFDRAELRAGDPVDTVSSRADAAVLCYPVISLRGEFGHSGSCDNFFGDLKTPELVNLYSGELNVPDNAPPVFLWHTSNDGSVHVSHSLRLGEALRNKNIDFEMHIYPDGRHGLGLATDYDRVNEWTQQCSRWLKTIGFTG